MEPLLGLGVPPSPKPVDGKENGHVGKPIDHSGRPGRSFPVALGHSDCVAITMVPIDTRIVCF